MIEFKWGWPWNVSQVVTCVQNKRCHARPRWNDAINNNNNLWSLKEERVKRAFRFVSRNFTQITHRGIILIRIDKLSLRNDDSRRSHIVNLSNWILVLYSWYYIHESKSATRMITLSNLSRYDWFPYPNELIFILESI